MSSVASVVTGVVVVAKAQGASVLELVCAGMAALCMGSTLPSVVCPPSALLAACGAPRNDRTDGPARRPVALPSGRTAWVLKDIRGRHLVAATRLLPTEDQSDIVRLTMAMVATCVEIDGSPLDLKAVRDLPIHDMFKLLDEGLLDGAAGAAA